MSFVSMRTVANGPIIQVAWVVEDIDAAESLWGSAFGIAKWTRIPDVHFGPGRRDPVRVRRLQRRRGAPFIELATLGPAMRDFYDSMRDAQ
jgi:hypothetical protein